jgi:hypothetical protein
VVLDEMKTGHCVYRLNVDDLDGGDEDAVTGMDAAWASQGMKSSPRRLPEPVLRLGYQSLRAYAHFEPLGSKIVATGFTNGNGNITFVYDTKTGRLDVGQPPPKGLSLWNYQAADVGNKLYTFGDNCRTTSHYLCEESELPEFGGYDSGEERMVFDMRGQTDKWVWKKSRSRRPRATDPSGEGDITSYAVHPDGCTLFVSYFFTSDMEEESRTFTFSIDTEDGQSARGEWSLPFRDRAYYDGHLDAWVGIRTEGTDSAPYLCSCDVPDLADPPKSLSAPEWKICKDELTFVEDASIKAFVHTGRGRFCLVETTPATLAERAENSQCTTEKSASSVRFPYAVSRRTAKNLLP